MPYSLTKADRVYKTFVDCGRDEEETAKKLGIKVSSVSRALRRYREFFKGKTKRGDKKNVLIFDIETSPIEAYVWSLWKQTIQPAQIIKDWSILSWAAKWLDEGEIMTGNSWDDGGDVRDDYECAKGLASLLHKADIIVAHNGDKFDIKRVNTRLLKHGLGEPAPFKSVDTLKIVKSRFAISSNRLDYVGEFLGIGRKVKHEGFELWRKVLHGDKEAQDNMLKYNVGDIVLLEQVYNAIRSWDKRCPNVNLDFEDRRCPCCGSENLKQVGDAYTNVSTFIALQCYDCGKYSRTGYNKKTKEDMQMTQRNIV